MELPNLKFILNYNLDIGEKRIPKTELMQASQGDVNLMMLKLKEWQFRGWLDIVADISTATDDQICVEMKCHIDNDRPWSDPMSGRM